MGVTISLPIPGPQGPQGPQGNAGSSGATGAQGPQGEGIQDLNAAAPITYNSTTKTIGIDKPDVADGGNF